MADKVFVTGGSGLLGQALLRRLRADGRQVRALARSAESAQRVAELGATPVRGDVHDAEALAAGLQGCGVAYHVAGANAFCLPDPMPLYRVNVRGSETVVRAAAHAGVDRLVYTSSASTLGEVEGTVGNENSPHRGSFLSHYERSKYVAEQTVSRVAREVELDVVTVNPSSVQGPGRSGGTARFLLDYLRGRLKVAVESRFSIVDIDDCTSGHLLAEEHGSAGERYVLSGATLSVRQGIDLLTRLTGVEHRTTFLPGQLAKLGAGAVEAVARPRGRQPVFCRELARTLLHGHTYDGSKATRELGLAYTPLESTVRRTVDWFVAEGLVTLRPQGP
ncbi:MAG: NAD-dependent epimerase/dehydratase family protein [Egibacteraceae bacterium]